MTIGVICVPGTGESYAWDERKSVSGMLKNVTDLLPADRFRAEWCSFPAAYGRGMSYAESVAIGERNLIAAIEADPDPVYLLGYSQGAQIVGNVAARLHTMPHLDVRGVGLLSDPSRHRDQWGGHLSAPEGYGACGERPILTALRPVWSLSAQGDPISSLPGGNALRTLADWSDFMSTRDLDGWAADIITDIRQRRMQPWWAVRNWRTWPGALAFARGLLLDGRHTNYWREVVPGTDRTYCQRLADLITASVNRD